MEAPETFESVVSRFKKLESWLYDESHESPEFHIYFTELQLAMQALTKREEVLTTIIDSQKTQEEILSKHLHHSVRADYDVAIYAAMDEYAEQCVRTAINNNYQV